MALDTFADTATFLRTSAAADDTGSNAWTVDFGQKSGHLHRRRTVMGSCLDDHGIRRQILGDGVVWNPVTMNDITRCTERVS